MRKVVVDLSGEVGALVGIQSWPLETLLNTVDGIIDGVNLEILTLRELVL